MSKPKDPVAPRRLTAGEQKFILENRRIDAGVSLFRIYCTGSTVVALGYFAYLSVDVMAGKSTDFKSIIDWGVRADVGKFLGYAIAAVFGTAFLLERSARKKASKRAGEASEMEKLIDHARTTSGVTPEGETPSERVP